MYNQIAAHKIKPAVPHKGVWRVFLASLVFFFMYGLPATTSAAVLQPSFPSSAFTFPDSEIQINAKKVCEVLYGTGKANKADLITCESTYVNYVQDNCKPERTTPDKYAACASSKYAAAKTQVDNQHAANVASTNPAAGTSPAASSPAPDSCGGPSQNVTISINIGCSHKGNPIMDALFAIIRFLSDGVGLVVIASIIVGGVQYSASRGDPQATAKAVTRIRSSVTAFLIFIFAYAFLNYLVPGAVLK